MATDNARFPHLLQKDIDVWKRFLADPPRRYTSFEYDVRVGTGRDPGSEYSDEIRRMAIGLSQRRIDAVGHTADTLDIIEITTAAGLHAIGQLTAYPILYRLTYVTPLPLIPVLVCESIQTDALEGIKRTGALIYVV